MVDKWHTHQRFCCRNHQRQAKKMGLGAPGEPPVKDEAPNMGPLFNPSPAPSPMPAASVPPIVPNVPKIQAPPGDLPFAAKWVIDRQEEAIKELKADREKIATKLEAAIKERNEFEKQLEKAQQEITRKPTALQGFAENVLSNPEGLASVLNAVPAILQGVRDVIKGGASGSSQAQLESAPAGAPSALDQWLSRQPEGVKTEFNNLMASLMRYPDGEQLKYVLMSLNQRVIPQA